MLNKKDFEKYKNDVKKIKGIMADMQKYILDHDLKIKKELVTEIDMQVTRETMETEFHERIKD